MSDTSQKGDRSEAERHERDVARVASAWLTSLARAWASAQPPPRVVVIGTPKNE